MANVWRSVCGLIRSASPTHLRVALHNLVEALPAEASPTAVDEDVPLGAKADQRGTPAVEVGAHRRDGLAADRHHPFLRTLAAGPKKLLVEIDVLEPKVDGLRRAQAARVEELEQRPVALRRRRAPLRRREQLVHLVTAQHVRKPLCLARAAQLGGRVMLDHALATEVAVERAQAGGLALQRRGGDRTAVVMALREHREEAGEVGVACAQHLDVVRRKVGAELEQVAAVGLERVA